MLERRTGFLVLLMLLSTGAIFSQKISDESSENRSVDLSKVYFTENKGQVHDQDLNSRPDVLFSGSSGNLTFHIRQDGISYQLIRQSADTSIRELTIYRTDINWLSSNNPLTVVKANNKKGVKNFYLAGCSKGITGVRSFKDVTLKNVYEGVDLHYYGKGDDLEYDFIVHPGSDYRQIKKEIKGANSVHISESGDLVISTPFGNIHELPPIAYQNGKEIKAKWLITGEEVSFQLGKYNRDEKLVIDPIVRVWGTYFGGGGADGAHDSDLDPDQNFITAGLTNSTSNVATTGAHQTTYSGSNDAYVSSFDKNGNIKWATYFGGSSWEESISVAVDGQGNVFVNGQTYSDSALATTGSHQDSLSSGLEGFLVKFDSSGIRQWATYIGGFSDDYNYDVATDGNGDIYICGASSSSTGIATAGSFQSSISWNGGREGFFVKFNTNGVRLWGSYYGGGSWDYAYALAIDKNNNVILGGRSQSTNLPGMSGAHQSSNGGGRDGYVAKFSSSGAFRWATYYGHSYNEAIHAVRTDSKGNVYAAGYANGSTATSSTAIATPNSHQPKHGGGADDCFLVKFDSSGTRKWGTYYGGNDLDNATDIFVDSADYVYLLGFAESDNAISTPNSYQPYYSDEWDNFIAQFNTNGVRQWATYYGGLENEGDISGHAHSKYFYIAGASNSSGLSDTSAYKVNNSGSDAFMAKFGNCWADSTYQSLQVCDSFVSPSGRHIWQISGHYSDTLLNTENCDSIIYYDLIVYGKVDSTLVISVCDSGNVELRAYTSSGKIYWYDVDSGGTALDSGNVFITPVLDSSKTYYIDIQDTNCGYLGRSPLTAFVGYTPVVDSVIPGYSCGYGSVTTAIYTSHGNIEWYDSFVGGNRIGLGNTYSSPNINIDTFYYAQVYSGQCYLNRIPVQGQIRPIPAITSRIGDTICFTGTANFSATSSLGIILWHDTNYLGTPIDTGNTYTTPVLSSFQTYYVSAYYDGCYSSRYSVPLWHLEPKVVYSFEDSVCDSGPVSIGLTGNGTVKKWFTTPTGGSSFFTGSVYSTSISSTTTYYVESSMGSCKIPTRLPLTAYAHVTPAVDSVLGDTVCNSGVVNLQAYPSAGLINWYSTSSGGSPLYTGFTYSPNISSTSTYWSEADYRGCFSVRKKVIGKVLFGSSSVLSFETCHPFTSPSGKYTWSKPGTYVDTVQNAVGCDSIITIVISKYEVNDTVISDGRTLQAMAQQATFKWLDCGSGIVIPGETDSTFTPLWNGSFAAIISQFGCADTSECVNINTVGEPELPGFDEVRLFPNPVNDHLNIQFSKEDFSGEILMYNKTGQLVYKDIIEESSQYKINMRPYAEGVYSIVIRNDKGMKSFRIVKR